MSFVAKDTETGCWNWTGRVADDGYSGSFHVNGKGKHAHRWAWILLRGPIAEGLQIDHLCRNRRCVNPDHLEPVTPRENTLRSLPFRNYVIDESRLRAICKNGHAMSGDNLGTRPDGGRKCLACMRDFQRAYLARKAARRAS